MIARTNLTKKLLLGISLIIGLNSMIFAHDRQYLIDKGANDSTHKKSIRKTRLGLEVGYGFSTLRGHPQAIGFLSRPYVSALMINKLSAKSEILTNIFYRTLGNRFSPGGYDVDSHSEIQFLGISANYLYKPLELPFYLGVGISGERNLKYRTISKYMGVEEVYTDELTFKKYNCSGNLLLQYRVVNRFLIEAKYSRGLINFFSEAATKANNFKVYPEGLFVGIGILF